MTENYFERFKQWQYYIHFILDGIIIAAIIYYFKLYGLPTILMITLFILLLLIVDSIVHLIFWFLPEPLQWRD